MKDLLKRLNPAPEVMFQILLDDGIFPNNARLPLILYRGAAGLPEENPGSVFEELYAQNQWGGSWKNGVFDFHHYHSVAHECLGILLGNAEVRLGGDSGITVEIKRGDVVIIPAGVAHQSLSASPDFSVIAAYPIGQSPDMNYGKPGERPHTDQNIAEVNLPLADPIYGKKGFLMERWK